MKNNNKNNSNNKKGFFQIFLKLFISEQHNKNSMNFYTYVRTDNLLLKVVWNSQSKAS